MSLDPSTFDYLKPTDDQMAQMHDCREGAKAYAMLLERCIPDGPDKTYIMRELRTLAMWVNVAITRDQSGRPRS